MCTHSQKLFKNLFVVDNVLYEQSVGILHNNKINIQTKIYNSEFKLNVCSSLGVL